MGGARQWCHVTGGEAAEKVARLGDGAVRMAVRACGWAVRLLARNFITRVSVAFAVLAGAALVAGYMLFFATINWFVTGRFGIVKSEPWKHRAELASSTGSITWLAMSSVFSGLSVFHITVITLFATAGAVVWFHRDAAWAATKAELRKDRPSAV